MKKSMTTINSILYSPLQSISRYLDLFEQLHNTLLCQCGFSYYHIHINTHYSTIKQNFCFASCWVKSVVLRDRIMEQRRCLSYSLMAIFIQENWFFTLNSAMKIFNMLVFLWQIDHQEQQQQTQHLFVLLLSQTFYYI